nr:MAG TPA: hypothetical protein [Caudoviricetes sp.]
MFPLIWNICKQIWIKNALQALKRLCNSIRM